MGVNGCGVFEPTSATAFLADCNVGLWVCTSYPSSFENLNGASALLTEALDFATNVTGQHYEVFPAR